MADFSAAVGAWEDDILIDKDVEAVSSLISKVGCTSRFLETVRSESFPNVSANERRAASSELFDPRKASRFCGSSMSVPAPISATKIAEPNALR